MPRYSSTWDVDIVTRYIASMGRNEDLSLKRLSQKLVVLMALVEASRTSESTEIEAKPSYTRPHKPVMSQRLAHWIKDLLRMLGWTRPSRHTHAVRGASASAAMNRGVSLSDILSTADWSKESTSYYRESKTADYVAKVLQGDKSAENW